MYHSNSQHDQYFITDKRIYQREHVTFVMVSAFRKVSMMTPIPVKRSDNPTTVPEVMITIIM